MTVIKDSNFQTGKVVAQLEDSVEGTVKERLLQVLDSLSFDDPVQRAAALAFALTIPALITLPDDTWVVAATDTHGQETVWSAHFSKEEALRWMPEWKKAMEARGVYTWFVTQRSGVHADFLRNADADPKECVL